MKSNSLKYIDVGSLRSDSEDEGRRYRAEFEKAKKRLPKEFIEIYETFHRFNDNDVLYFSVLTERPGFTEGLKDIVPNKIKMAIRDIDTDMVCEILISGVKEISFQYKSYEGADYLDDYLYDSILIDDDEHLSWEIEFAGYARLRMVFKELSARLLSEEEIEKLKKPL